MIQVLILATVAGGMIPLGAAMAQRENLQPGWLEDESRHAVIAFGAGALLAAVAFVLVPDGSEKVPAWSAPVWLLIGGIAMGCVDGLIARAGDSPGQFIAMLADFLPEIIALGALSAIGGASTLLLAGLIALQNLPEGFNAYRERQAQTGAAPGRILAEFCALATLGPLGAALGYVYFADRPAVLGAMMLLAAGAILYLMFQDIAPQVKLERAWLPPLGAVAGMALGLAGHLILG